MGAYYLHTDALGSPVARTDAAGNLVSRTRYEPYGLTAMGQEPDIGFAGHVNDGDTGLVYMQQRYYDPIAGRMLSIDPVLTDASQTYKLTRSYDVHGSQSQKPRGKGQKSVTEIAEMGEILIKVVKQPDDSFIVIYYPQKYKWEIDNSINFLEKQWMKKYFACEFRIVSESIKLHHSFCFAETGGPFPDTY